MENCFESAPVRCQGFSTLPRRREQRVLQHLPTSHSAFHLVISKNSSGAVDTDKCREQWRLPVGEELGISVINSWREVHVVECGARTVLYHCLKDVDSCSTIRRVNLR